jgi:hypothetical protein
LFFTPAVIPCTFTDTVQLVFGATLAPESDTEDDPFGPVVVPEQVLFRFPGVAMTMPAGRLSVKATPVIVRFWLLLLSTVKVKLVVPFSGMVTAPNALTAREGLLTVRVSEEVLPLPASVESIVTLLL